MRFFGGEFSYFQFASAGAIGDNSSRNNGTRDNGTDDRGTADRGARDNVCCDGGGDLVFGAG